MQKRASEVRVPKIEKILVVTGHISPKKSKKFEARTIPQLITSKDDNIKVNHFHWFLRNLTDLEFKDRLNYGGAPDKVILVSCTDHLLSRVVGHFNALSHPPVMVVVDERMISNKLGLPVVREISHTKEFRRG